MIHRVLAILALVIILISCSKGNGDSLKPSGLDSAGTGGGLPPTSNNAPDKRDGFSGKYSFIGPSTYQYLQPDPWPGGQGLAAGTAGYYYGELPLKDTGSFSITKPKSIDSSAFIYLNQFFTDTHDVTMQIGFILTPPPVTTTPVWLANNPQTLQFRAPVKFKDSTVLPNANGLTGSACAKLKDSADVTLITGLYFADYRTSPWLPGGPPVYSFALGGNGVITKDSIIINYHSQYRMFHKFGRMAVLRH
ncbi:MAG: hypothetical protein JWN76_74 [Chitinophagaceae bacterium]|nr:hypothetical protein [Chitinophagaceae bacterium]